MTTDLQLTADAIAPSDLLPAAYRGKPANVLVAAHLGARYGWDPATSCQLVLVVDGKPTLSGGAMLGLIRQAGHSVSIQHGDGECVVRGKRADNGDTLETCFTMKEAAQAGLSKRRAWVQYPQDMLQWRAISRLARGLFSDVLLGVAYTPDEVAQHDADGLRTLDVAPVPAIEAADSTLMMEVVAPLEEDERLLPRAVWKSMLLTEAGGDKVAAADAVKKWEYHNGPADTITRDNLDDMVALIGEEMITGEEPF